MISLNIFQSTEFFLAKEVTHFVTDKPFEQRDQNCPSPLLQTPVSHQQLTPKTPRTPQKPYTPHFCDLDDAISPNVAISNESKVSQLVHHNKNKKLRNFFLIRRRQPTQNAKAVRMQCCNEPATKHSTLARKYRAFRIVLCCLPNPGAPQSGLPNIH